MPDSFSTNVLLGVVQSLLTIPSAFLDRYFTRVSADDSEEIHFEKILGKRRISPFVAPYVAGKVIASRGRELKTFKPAYIKDKRVFDPTQPIKRAVGERIGGGELTMAQRRDAYLAGEMQDQLEMLQRRLEVMAVESVRTGKCTVAGDDYPAVSVDFGRDATLTGTPLASTARWGQSAATPLVNLRAWQKLVRQKSGVNPKDVVMGDDAFEAFIADTDVEKKLDLRNLNGVALDIGVQDTEGLSYQGTINSFNIFTYSGWYVDPLDSTEKEIWPADIVALLSPMVEGVRAYGAIRDGKAGLRAVPWFPKMWEEDDPAVEFLMMQSAPLMVPTRPDATFSIDVL